MSKPPRRYLEDMTIADANRLANKLGISLIVLLAANHRLCEDIRNGGRESPQAIRSA